MWDWTSRSASLNYGWTYLRMQMERQDWFDRFTRNRSHRWLNININKYTVPISDWKFTNTKANIKSQHCIQFLFTLNGLLVGYGYVFFICIHLSKGMLQNDCMWLKIWEGSYWVSNYTLYLTYIAIVCGVQWLENGWDKEEVSVVSSKQCQTFNKLKNIYDTLNRDCNRQFFKGNLN